MRVKDIGLCEKAAGLPGDPHNWWMEPKLDGIRMIVDSRDGHVSYTSRNGNDFGYAFPMATQALQGLDLTIDVEAVWFDPATGEVDFHRGSGIVRSKDAVARQRREGHVTLMVFDFLRLGDRDVRREPIESRRVLIPTLIGGLECPVFAVMPYSESSEAARREYVDRYREGVVLKRKGSTYPVGRSRSWLKLKVVQDEDVVIMGAERGEGKYFDTLGALVFGQYQNGVLTRRGTCSGMTDAQRDHFWLHINDYVGRVMVIRHMGNLAGGDGFRHPQFHSIRDTFDKAPRECTWS